VKEQRSRYEERDKQIGREREKEVKRRGERNGPHKE